MRSIVNFSLAALLVSGSAVECRATGFYGPTEYFRDGGPDADASPEFYWELEVKRLAGGFHPAEQRVVAVGGESYRREGEAEGPNPRDLLTAKADLDDFAAALKEGKIKPPDPARAKAQHDAARKFVSVANADTAGALPEEFASEFAAYHRGAAAYRRGGEHLAEAFEQWEALLKLPEGERHYRSVWAAFMLGKAALKTGSPEAVKWFQRTRELAKAGFADSLGMAADSYGWEGRSEWKQGHPEKAAPLFLTQLALGDESAIVSLKALIPDRVDTEGMLNYDAVADVLDGLKAAARDPLLRRLVTAHILATGASSVAFGGDAKAAEQRGARWLAIIKEAKISGLEDAEYLGWAAYQLGNYKDAARWLEAAKETPAAWWLRSKLLRRAGKMPEAAQSMAKAWESIHDPSRYTAWKGGADAGEPADATLDGESWSFRQEASGELAKYHLERADFIQALDTLWKGKLSSDAAFVAERILTLDELKKYVDQQPLAAAPAVADVEDPVTWLRYVLGRRCVREDRYDEAAHYLKSPYDKILQIYVKALNDGANEKLSKEARARAWFAAAWLARHDGMELMGTEGAPDSFETQGDFESTDLASQQLAKTVEKVTFENGEEKRAPVPIPLRVTNEERTRLQRNKIEPNIRYHYRVIAAALAMRAAKLLPDNSEELADVVNTAGLWVQDRDEKTGDRYYQVLEKRCARSQIGRTSIAKGKFIEQPGPWSDAEQKTNEAMHQKLDPKKPDQ